MLAKNYPEIDFYLNFYPFEPFELYTDEKGLLNARQGDFILHDRDHIKVLDHTTLLYIYGLGLGLWFLQIESFLAKNTQHHLVILEDDLGVIEAFLKTSSASIILDHPQITLKFIASTQMWKGTLNECARDFAHDHIQITALKSYAKKNPARLRQIKDRLHRKTLFWNALLKEELLAPEFHQNIFTNMLKLPQAFYVNKWQKAFKDVPAIICGAGPSLSKAHQALKMCGDKALILAGGSAIAALGHMNITPHFAVALDPNYQEYEHLKHLKCDKTPLIFSSRLHPKARELFTGPLGYLSSQTGGPLEAFLEKKFNLTDPPIGPDLGQEALSVTTLSTSLAYFWGCNPIIFVGVDMAYTDMKMYAPGVVQNSSIISSDPIIWRKNTQGRRVPTLVKWIMESQTLSRYARTHPDRLFFNASEGLGFKDIPHKNLDEIIQAFSPQLHLKERILKHITDTKMTLSHKEITAVFRQLEDSLVKCQTLIDNLLQDKTLDSGLKAVLEMDLQDEIAYAPLLEAALFAFRLAKYKSFLIPQEITHPLYLERALQFEQAKWTYLKECIQKEIIIKVKDLGGLFDEFA